MTIRRLAIVWLVLLVASHMVRRSNDAPEPLPEGKRAVSIATPDRPGEDTRLAYRVWEPPEKTDASWILLLHGSPGSSADFRHLGPALAREYRVLAPDLPGFGSSSRRVPDYSIRAHSFYAERLLDHLGIDSPHLVGFSMGGGVALELVDRSSNRFRSLTLLSSIGVVELELLGTHRMNRAVHLVQLVALWVLHEATPHFGLLDDFPLDVAYARNFFDSDQRPLRRILRELDLPTLVVHGKDDFLVPVEAAEEHHRLVPQSELVVIDSDHFMVFRRDGRAVAPIAEFVGRVEEGLAVKRADADPARLAAAVRPFDPGVTPRATGATLLVVMALLVLATLVSEDLTCIAAGLLVAQGRLGFATAAIACGAGIFVGDVLLFLAGRHLGRPWLDRRPLSWWLGPGRVARSARWFEKRGPAVIFLSRFLPGARFPTYFAAGLLPLRLRALVGWFLLAVFVWTPLLVALSAWVGVGMYEYFEAFRRWALPALLAVAFVVWIALFLAERLLTFTGRRRLVGTWKRWTRWEFWPPWLFYQPVVAHILGLAARYRSPTLFTAANPAFPAGGFVGESKGDILDLLPHSAVARFRTINAADDPPARLEQIETFVQAGGGALPVVLKPDVGERGRGVVIARDWRTVRDYAQRARRDFLVQEYVEGREYGVFWVRPPDEENGRILSITEKVLPVVVGDGESTLERLILVDERAVTLAPMYIEYFGERALSVPPPGEKVALTDLGTHCRGAIFLDGRRLRTPELERAMGEIAAAVDGFFFGRFDLMAPDESSLRLGRNLRVLELNGVTSEATHIYDPSYRLRDAYRVLFEQWRLAFEIGAQNHRRGAPVATTGELVRRVLRRTSPGLY